MTFDEWLIALKTRLSPLGFRKQLVFAGSCCERLLRNYVEFTKETGWGDPEGLREVLNLVWRIADSAEMTPLATLGEALEVCDSAAPDTELFQSDLTSAALDAANAIAETIEFVGDKNLEHLVVVSSLSRDSIDLYIQRRDAFNYSDDKLESAIANDPLMTAEIKKQQNDLRELELIREESSGLVNAFRKHSLVSERGNLGI